MSPISFDVPIRAPSASNLREHWAAKHKRVDAQKAATRRRCPEWTAGPLLVVRLTRVAPRPLDDDNLRGALKAVRDALAQWLRVDDRSPLVRWEYAQQKASQKKGAPPVDRVRVEVEPAGSVVYENARGNLDSRARWPGEDTPWEEPREFGPEFGESSTPLAERLQRAREEARPPRPSAKSLAALAVPNYRKAGAK